MKKFFGVTSLVILILAVWLLWLNPSVQYPDSLHPEMIWNNGNTTSLTLPHHSFTLDARQKQLIITNLNGDSVFETPAGEAFVGGSYESFLAKENRGSFLFSYRSGRRCEKQSLEQITSTSDSKVIVTGTLLCENKRLAWKLEIEESSNNQLNFWLTLPEGLKRSNVHFISPSNERFYGGGAQYTHLALKGLSVPLWSSEQGIGRGLQPLTFIMNLISQGSGGNAFTTYFSSGQFLSSQNRGLVVHGKNKAMVHFKDSEVLTLDQWAPNIHWSIVTGDSPKQVLTALSEITGRMRSLPDWVHRGAVVGLQGGTDSVLKKLRSLLGAGASVSGLWIQDWVGQRKTSIGKQLWWNWRLNEKHYKDWPQFKKFVDQQNIQLLGYVNPMLVATGDKDWLSEALENDYLVNDDQGKPIQIKITSFDAHLLDVTNPSARKWWLGKMQKEFLGWGFKGWMADFGEALPTDAVLADGVGLDLHNRYVEDWVQLNRTLVDRQSPSGEFLFFNRAGFTSSPASSTLFWLGDQMVSWDHLDGMKSSLSGLLSSGISGAVFNHSDIGGYTSINIPFLKFLRSKELLIRWMELNTFTSVFRSHEGNLPDDSLQIYSNSQLVKHFSQLSNVFAELFEYRKFVMRQASQKGWPVVRPLWLELPLESSAWAIEDQFFMGPDIMVAPILEPEVHSRSVWIPPGEWTHLFSNEKFHSPRGGRKMAVKAPLGQPVALIRTTSAWAAKIHIKPIAPMIK